MYMALVNDIRIAWVSYLPLPPLHVTNGMSSLVIMPLNCFFTLSALCIDRSFMKLSQHHCLRSETGTPSYVEYAFRSVM